MDKLVNLALRDGTATLGDVRYEGKELLLLFLKQALCFPQQKYEEKNIRQAVFAVKKMEPKLNALLRECAVKLGISEKRVQIVSHSEAYIYYTLNQKREIWNNTIGMFDLSEAGLRYYEMKVQLGMKKTMVVAEYEELEEGFNLDILDTSSGSRLADKILCSCAERLMARKSYSAVFLTGKGFQKWEWAAEFMKLLCTKRRVYMEQGLFAKGAASKAADCLQEGASAPFTCICEGRLRTTISMNVLHRGQENPVVVASAGDNWYGRVSVIDVIPDHQNRVDFVMTPVDTKKKKIVSIPLEGFPKRFDRTMKVQIQIAFLDEKTMEVTLKDRGFGELFPATNVEIKQEVML